MSDSRNSKGQMSNRELLGWVVFILVSIACGLLAGIN
jgi:hypothetical protein